MDIMSVSKLGVNSQLIIMRRKDKSGNSVILIMKTQMGTSRVKTELKSKDQNEVIDYLVSALGFNYGSSSAVERAS